MIPANVSLGALLDENKQLRAELARRDEAVTIAKRSLDENAARFTELHDQIEDLTEELARRDEQITAVRALCDRLLAQKGWRGVLNMAALHVPTASAHEILAALDGGAS